VVAEIGINHNGSLDTAEQLVREAVACGADAVKFQTFKTEHLIRPEEPKMPYQVRAGETENQFEMLKKVELDWPSHLRLQELCRDLVIDFISTPYDRDSVDLLVELGMSELKVASTDTTNVPFLRYLEALDTSPVTSIIISSGATALEELDGALAVFDGPSRGRVVLMHCVSYYPAPLDELNLACLRELERRYGCPTGFSDHTDDVDVGAYAVAAGARILEKHFTLDKDAPGPDHRASLVPDEMRRYIENVRKVSRCLGDGVKRVAPCEAPVKVRMQKSLVARRALEKGTALAATDLSEMRPATGISPLRVDEVVGRRLREPKAPLEELRWSDLEEA
jgi:sialic acid synthase SpsE